MRDLAIDLGTANTLVFVRDQGIVLNEPTVIAMNERTGDALAMGREAWDMLGRAPEHIVPVRPLRHGAITDFEVTERLIRLVFQKIGVGRFAHPRALIAVSSSISTVERRAVEEAAHSAGARHVSLIAEPIAGALGAGLAIDQPAGNCIIDVGGGTTEVAVISMGGVVSRRAVRIGGFDVDDEIQKFLRREYGIAIGERTAEAIKKELASAHPMDDEPKAEIRGRELATGMPKAVVVHAEELRAALDDVISRIIDAVRGCLSETPPELAHDVLDRGITLTGGGGMLRGLDLRIQADTTIPIRVADSPLETVVMGAGRALNSMDRLRSHGIVT